MHSVVNCGWPDLSGEGLCKEELNNGDKTNRLKCIHRNDCCHRNPPVRSCVASQGTFKQLVWRNVSMLMLKWVWVLPIRSYAPFLLRGQVGIGAHCTLAHLSDIVTFAKTDFFRLIEIMAIVSFANHYFLKSHRNHSACKFCQKIIVYLTAIMEIVSFAKK